VCVCARWGGGGDTKRGSDDPALSICIPPQRDAPTRTMQATVGAAALDYAQVLLRRQVVLTNIPTGTARVVFSELDLGNFLVHPLVTEAAKTAVKVRAVLVCLGLGGWGVGGSSAVLMLRTRALY